MGTEKESSTDPLFIGSWRQIAPDPAPHTITITFRSDGGMVWSIDGAMTQEIPLSWRSSGETLFTRHAQSDVEDQSPFRIEPPSTLVLEKGGEIFRYSRLA